MESVFAFTGDGAVAVGTSGYDGAYICQFCIFCMFSYIVGKPLMTFVFCAFAYRLTMQAEGIEKEVSFKLIHFDHRHELIIMVDGSVDGLLTFALIQHKIALLIEVFKQIHQILLIRLDISINNHYISVVSRIPLHI